MPNRNASLDNARSAYRNLRPVYDEWAWQEESNCQGEESELFFLDPQARGKNKRDKEKEAKKICKGCPVVQQCLAHALAVPEFYGVWGGMTPEQRLKILEKRLS
jgi:WhiB family redox-sensing transcriptional regulator